MLQKLKGVWSYFFNFISNPTLYKMLVWVKIFLITQEKFQGRNMFPWEDISENVTNGAFRVPAISNTDVERR